MSHIKPIEKLVDELKERAKELNCLYEVQELLNNPKVTINTICKGIINAIPPGWQYPDVCQVKLDYNDKVYQTENFKVTPWIQCTDINVQEKKVGEICVSYTEERPEADEGPFLKEERKLINTIAEQFGLYVLHQQLKSVFEEKRKIEKEKISEWGVILDLLERTDPNLLIRISRKMVNYLCWTGVKDAEKLLEQFSPAYKEESELLKELNRPYQRQAGSDLLGLSHKIFQLADSHLNKEDVINSIQKWIKEDRSGFLVNILEDAGSSLSEISSAIERYHHLGPQGLELSAPREMSFRIALIRRLLSDQAEFIHIAKQFVEVDDFTDIMHRIIFPVGSHGKLGGKISGLILAKQILKKSEKNEELFKNIKTPKTWYLTSDALLNFMSYNNLEEIIEQKYKDIGQVRQEYPYVVHVFKNSPLAPEIIKGLSLALDDLGKVPLIVRSSSLLEDGLGAAFAGKYKSLFIANQGTKEERLSELIDAIAEVYASTFGPDPIEYRMEQGLLDYHEEMGIMIQEVVGKKIGNHFLPAFAGVAFSQNEFRWSSRIKREDGLVRIVPGLGTRAVDRLSNDYPILIAPGQPGLRVNASIDEIIRYSPKYIDVINLETKTFETVEVQTIIKKYGRDYPYVNKLVSILKENHIQQPRTIGTDYTTENFVVTFEGLVSQTPFVKQVQNIIKVLKDSYNHPIDIEFAHDGEHFYLLQCRSQSFREEIKPVAIPKNIPEDKILFSANRFISNGIVPDISHIVYIDPQKYSEISNYHDLLSVGRLVGRLNKILPKRHFILMGPGRWGSRGDIKLGVSVSYSEINNTSILIEIARKQGDYVPDLSFGTHFFQDLVEANIRYLPLYPDDSNITFNETFFSNSKNIFPDILPDYAHLKDVIKVIDISGATNGQKLNILMNANEEKALGFLSTSSEESLKGTGVRHSEETIVIKDHEEHWRWRQRNAEELASKLDPEYFGIKAFYLFGSTKNATAGPESDIDILIHFQGSEKQRKELMSWLNGWSQCLSYSNFLRTGCKTNGLLDIHILTDKDIEKRTSYAAKIGAVTDAARPIPMGTGLKKKS